jgi:hypothetical protein
VGKHVRVRVRVIEVRNGTPGYLRLKYDVHAATLSSCATRGDLIKVYHITLR